MAGLDPLQVAKAVDESMSVASRALQKATKDLLADAAKVARKEIGNRPRLALGADRAFSNLRRGSPVPLKVTAKVRPGIVSVLPSGPWGMVEGGAVPHQAKAWGRGSFDHPGTPGRGLWSAGREATFRELGGAADEVGRKVEAAFGGS